MADHTTVEPLAAVAIGPHPDDVELCCGGTLALLAHNGWRVGIIDLTRGELASNGTAEQRQSEARAALKVLGLAHRENLGFPDGFVSAGESPVATPSSDAQPAQSQLAQTQLAQTQLAQTQLGRLVLRLRELAPEIVFAPHPQAVHPDHRAASELTTRAVFFAGVAGFLRDIGAAPRRPSRLLYYPMRVPVEPTFVVDVSAHYATKLAAIHCYGSQLTRDNDSVATATNSPLQLESVQARDRLYGARIGAAHGEGFVVQATLAVLDPVAFFRANPADTPLVLPPLER